ncbi:MAG TPA: helix-turn-helix transcriptional regulator [Thermoanaerobaculia bacterium]|nr:helix-turn-helix transcriptional regulator [Thermoanaerobaculia bacterium]
MAVDTTLRERRVERDWSQGDLAKLAGVSRQTINAIETGRYEPSLSLALKLARLFGCSVEELFSLP